MQHSLACKKKQKEDDEKNTVKPTENTHIHNYDKNVLSAFSGRVNGKNREKCAFEMMEIYPNAFK